MRVLLGSADANLRLSLELLLSEEPGTTIAGTAMAAEGLLALAATSDPDMVIIDWELPGRSIKQLVQEIHELKIAVGVILLGKKTEVRQSVLQDGIDAYVVKGSPPETLLNVFRDVRAELKRAAADSIEQ